MSLEKKTQITTFLNSSDIKDRIVSLFSRNETKAEKFKAALLNVALEPHLQNCSTASIIKAALTAAELDLSLSKNLGQAYIVKYKADAELSIGYKGWKRLAERADKVTKDKPVYKCDKFEFVDYGFTETIIFTPNFNERKEHLPTWCEENLLYMLVCVKDLKNNNVENHVISADKLKQIAGFSPSKQSKHSAYVDWYIEMMRAKAIKYVLSKTALNDDRLAQAIEVDNSFDFKAQQELKNVQNSEANAELDLNEIFLSEKGEENDK